MLGQECSAENDRAAQSNSVRFSSRYRLDDHAVGTSYKDHRAIRGGCECVKPPSATGRGAIIRERNWSSQFREQRRVPGRGRRQIECHQSWLARRRIRPDAVNTGGGRIDNLAKKTSCITEEFARPILHAAGV